MENFRLDTADYPQELAGGLEAIRREYGIRFDGGDRRLIFKSDQSLLPGGLAVTVRDGEITVGYARKGDAFRALGRLLGQEELQSFAETSGFDMQGVMFDVSRNGVLTVKAAKALLLRCALMGINTAMLYSEDTYEVPGEPFFGYLRGRYSLEELHEIDDYAFSMGVEVVPCLRPLQILKASF